MVEFVDTRYLDAMIVLMRRTFVKGIGRRDRGPQSEMVSIQSLEQVPHETDRASQVCPRTVTEIDDVRRSGIGGVRKSVVEGEGRGRQW